MFDLQDLLVLAPEADHAQLVVAGSYLADPERASDLDLWLLAGSPDGANQAMQGLHAHLAPLIDQSWQRAPDGFTTFTINGNSAAFGAGVPPAEYEDALRAKGLFYVGTFQKENWPKPVQFFVTPYASVGELLGDFDISTHQLAAFPAVDHGRLRITGPGWTPLGEMPRVTNWTTPSTTLARLERICLRYGFYPIDAHPDVNTLVGSIPVRASVDAAA